MTLFTKPLGKITYDDVTTFCQEGHEESVNLEYKKDFPKDLEKSISALANTSGGLIIIGVDERNNRLRPPFEGIDFFDKAGDRVWSINVDNIYPPVEINVNSIPNAANSKMFVLIRVPESHQSPHAIWNRTHVYIRTGNRAKPEELANFEQLEWLQNRRKKSEDLYALLENRAEEHLANLMRNMTTRSGICTLIIAPCYPRHPMKSPIQLRNFMYEERVTDNFGFVVPPSFDDLILAQNAVYTFSKDENGRPDFFELSTFGLIFYRTMVTDVETLGGAASPENFFKSKKLLSLLDLTLDFAGRFYQASGYYGVVKIKLHIDNILNARIFPPFPNSSMISPGEWHVNKAQKFLEWELTESQQVLIDQGRREKFVVSTIADLCLAFGEQIPYRQIEEVMKER